MGTMIWHFDSSLAVNYCTFGCDHRKLVGNAATNDANDVIFLWRQSSLTCSSDAWQCIFMPNFDGFGEFDLLNVVSHRADPKKALPCMNACIFSHCASKSAHGSLQYSSPRQK